MSVTPVRRLLVLTALFLLAVPAGADAARRHVVSGAGYGHGVGMSQWGAYGFAKKGHSYEQILAHYYSGTRFAKVPNGPVRVLLQDRVPEVSFSGAAAAGGRRFDPDRTYRVRAAGAGVEVRTAGGKLVGRAPRGLSVSGSAGVLRLGGRAINGVANGSYRGTLELRPGPGGMMAVNAVPLEDYLRGVVPGESPSSWPIAALRAQAVAARSYALATDRGGGVYDQLPDTRSQVYNGVGAEQKRTDQAIADTAGQVLAHGGRVATTYFFSASGGRTENIENVFYGARPLPYLRSVRDPYDSGSPRHRWKMAFTSRTMEAKLGNLVKGRLLGVKVVRRGISPRIVRAVVRGTRGTSSVNGATLKARLGLPETWAYFSSADARARSLRHRGATSWTARLLPGPRPAGVVEGSLDPRPTAGGAVLERRSGRSWRRVRRVATRTDGSYRVGVASSGRYRVRAGATASETVRVR